ncbi:hypothetical protein CBR_g46620 [Chara braunii]|uniref:Reverse transcriptase domain-containing protein n=1 Tax=Chara braunii TaxID=69332 RepID=A0A388M0R7_CHABU|nr:hypothetical protein CBR_g46620 [Chara braunii]|eukprot:GBG88131.1 hypothetical protein CBR_g46620 [Chara braunii]
MIRGGERVEEEGLVDMVVEVIGVEEVGGGVLLEAAVEEGVVCAVEEGVVCAVEEGVVCAVEEGGAAVVTTVMEGLFPLSVVTRSDMDDMVAFMTIADTPSFVFLWVGDGEGLDQGRQCLRKYFSKLDLKSGYHQIEIQPRDRYRTAFKTRYGHFEWIVMPFGLTNARTTFQAAMTTEFHDLLDRTVLVYLDDILVYSRLLDEHLRAVLERLRITKYKANHGKCKFAQQELEYLGHYVMPQGIRPLTDKVPAIQDWSDLKCTTDVRSFFGLASYYMRFVKGFQRITAPLSRLQSPLVPFEFNDEARHVFHTLKTTLLQAPALNIYDPTLPTKVTTDTSGYDIGAVLEQHDGTDRHPVEYFSQKVWQILSSLLYNAADDVNSSPKYEQISANASCFKHQTRIAAILRERKEKKELLKQAKLKAIAEEQAAKKKQLEEEMLRFQKEKMLQQEEEEKIAEEEAAAEEEEEEEGELLERRRGEERGEVNGTEEEDKWREKKISEWVANLSLGEDEEAQLYVPQEEREAFARALELIEDPLECQATEDEKKLEWKLKMMREKKRREEASRIAGEVERVRTGRQELQAQTEVSAKLDKMMGFLEVLSEAWLEEHQACKGQEVTLQAMRSGLREFVSDVVGHVGSEIRRLRDGLDNFCAGAIETAKVVATTEAMARPRKELVKKEQLEDQVFVVYVRPVTEPKEEDSSTDPAIAKLLEEFKDLAESPTGVVSRPIQHTIEIGSGSRTPKGAVYRISPRDLEELRKKLDKLLEKGWIRPSSSFFGAPVLFVPNKEGELRLCIDYRGMNEITVKNVEPLPRIDDLLDRVQGCKYFSKIDLKFGYHQIEVHPNDQYKTTFQTRYGHYEFIVMPFGLTNAPATFQQCMSDLFRPWLDSFVVVYLDDILVFSRTLQEHQGHLRQVLEKLREDNFKINAKKCEWAKTQVLYLGHVLDGDGIKPEDSKIAAIWEWDKDCTFALKKLKRALIEYPVLKVADPSLSFVVTTDASQYGIGVVFQQDDGNGYGPVEFMSARMPSEKVATSTYERELYALRQALEHWKHFLLGRHFKAPNLQQRCSAVEFGFCHLESSSVTAAVPQASTDRDKGRAKVSSRRELAAFADGGEEGGLFQVGAEKEVKKLALLEEQSTKKRELEEEMKLLLKEQEEKTAAVEKEEEDDEEEEVPEASLERMTRGVIEERGESSGSALEVEVGKMVGEWASKMEIGEEREAELLVPQAEREAGQRELEAYESPLQKKASEQEKMLEWKLRLATEKKIRLQAAEEEKKLRVAEESLGNLPKEAGINQKSDTITQTMTAVLKAQQDQVKHIKGHDLAIESIRLGFKDFVQKMMVHMSTEFHSIM